LTYWRGFDDRQVIGLTGGGTMAEDVQVKREIVLEADAQTLERMRKEGHARGFTVYCDEGERIGGDGIRSRVVQGVGFSGFL